MSLIEFIQSQIGNDPTYVAAIAAGFLFIVVHDFYLSLCSAITSWIKRR